MRSLFALAALPLAFAAPTPQGSGLEHDRYMVVLKKDTTGSTQDALGGIAGGILSTVTKDHIYELGKFKGFAGLLSDSQVAAIENDPRVAYVEKDGVAHTQQSTLVTQTGVPWGLARLSSRKTGTATYTYDPSAGAGVCVYIVDTGISPSNPEFEGRATFVKNYAGTELRDGNGHGTHVSGTIGSKSYGVAKKALLFGIKVLDDNGSGSWSDIVSGIGLVVSDSKTRSCPNGVVINMSLGGSKSQAVNDAVASAVDAGVFMAVAAGNEAQDFSNTSPASEPKAFAVGASDSTDTLASFSNYGQTLGIIAPGVDILSTWSDGTTQTISGTSMASPHVAGLAAYILGLEGPMTPAALGKRLQALGTKNVVKISGVGTATTPNLLAFNGASA